MICKKRDRLIELAMKLNSIGIRVYVNKKDGHSNLNWLYIEGTDGYLYYGQLDYNSLSISIRYRSKDAGSGASLRNDGILEEDINVEYLEKEIFGVEKYLFAGMFTPIVFNRSSELKKMTEIKQGKSK